MSSKKVSDMIIDKLAEKIKKEGSFDDISQELTNKIKEEKHTKEEIVILLKKAK